MSKVFLKKGDVEICFGNVVDFSGEFSTSTILDLVKEERELLLINAKGHKERILGKIEGILMGLGCEKEKTKALIRDIELELEEVVLCEDRIILLMKMVELLEEGWIYEKED